MLKYAAKTISGNNSNFAIFHHAATTEIVLMRICRATQTSHYYIAIICLLFYIAHIVGIDNLDLLHHPHIHTIL